MVRTQVYLTDYEKKALESIAEKSGGSQSSLIREAIDWLIHTYEQEPSARLHLLRKSRGTWRKSTAKDLEKIRQELDRY